VVKTGKNWGKTEGEKGSPFLISVFCLPSLLRFVIYPQGARIPIPPTHNTPLSATLSKRARIPDAGIVFWQQNKSGFTSRPQEEGGHIT
jgi:hypothetical protein